MSRTMWNVDQKRHVLLKYGVLMLACIPSARDACEHDYSVFQHGVPFLVDVPIVRLIFNT
jgi:hypothetical protein